MTPSQPALLRELQNDQRWLVTISRRLLAQESDAEDIAQEASLRALEERAGRRVVPEQDARPWLIQTVKRLAWNANRRHAGRPSAGSTAPPLEDLRDVTQQGPLDALARAEFRKDVAALVMELPEMERQTLVLRFYEDLSTTEIMEATGAPTRDAVRQRLSRGIRRLRERLDSRKDAADWRHAAIALSGTVSSKGAAGSLASVGWALLAIGVMGAVAAVWRSSEGADLSAHADGPTLMGEDRVIGTEFPFTAAPTLRGDRIATEPAVQEAQGSVAVTEVAITLKDEASGQRIVGQPWWVILTGENDYGRAWGFASTVPNPEPIARGVTDGSGTARFTLPSDVLVNLVTERTDQHARGSWPIRIDDGAAQPEEVLLSQGTTFSGRVVDDRGEPRGGLVLATRTYFDEWLRLGTTDDLGRFKIQRCADFPRSFVIREDDSVEPTRTLRTEVAIMAAAALGRADVGPNEGVKVRLRAGNRLEAEVKDVLFPRGATVEGQVFDASGSLVMGALVSTNAGEDGSPCETDHQGRYRLSIPARALRGHGIRLTATSPEGVSGALELLGLAPGTVREGSDLVLDSAGDVRILFTDASEQPRPFARAAAAEQGATLQWDVTGGKARAPLLETPDGGLVALPARRLPDRGDIQGSLMGTAFVPGFRAARLELPQGTDEVAVALEPLPKAHLKLAISGAAVGHFIQAKVTITAEPPELGLSPAQAASSVSDPNAMRTVAYHWKNGEVRALDLAAGSGFYLYVTLFPGSARAPRVLPVQGPIDLADATAEAPYAITAAVHSWPERARLDRAFDEGVASVALNARRPTTIVARVVDSASHEFIDGAIVRSVDERHHHRSLQRMQDGKERALRLEASLNQMTLHFAAKGYAPMELGPIALIPGEEVQLGDIALEPLRRVTCRLIGPDGAPVRGVRPLRWSDPAAGRVRIKTSAAGEADLFIGAGLPKAIEVQRRSGSRAPTQLVRPQWSVRRPGEEECVLVVQRWQPVRLRLQGLGPVWRHGVSEVLVEDVADPSGSPPSAVTCGSAHASGDDVVVDLHLPPGTWAISPSTPRFVTFPHVEVVMEESPVEVTIAARLGDDVPR